MQQKEIKMDNEAEKGSKVISEMPSNDLFDIEDPFAKKVTEPKQDKPSDEAKKKVDFPFDDPFDV